MTRWVSMSVFLQHLQQPDAVDRAGGAGNADHEPARSLAGHSVVLSIAAGLAIAERSSQMPTSTTVERLAAGSGPIRRLDRRQRCRARGLDRRGRRRWPKRPDCASSYSASCCSRSASSSTALIRVRKPSATSGAITAGGDFSARRTFADRHHRHVAPGADHVARPLSTSACVQRRGPASRSRAGRTAR